MPTLPHLLPRLEVVIKKPTVLQYHATVVWVCP